MSKYEINIGTSILSIPNVRTSQTTLNSLFAINHSAAGNSYPLQVVNQDVTSGNNAIIGVGHAPIDNGNGNSTQVSHKYFGSNNAGNNSYFGLSGTGKPNLTFTNNGTVAFNNCTLPATSGGTGLSAVGSNGQVLTVVSGAPAWASVTAPSIIGSTLGYSAGANQTIATNTITTMTLPSAVARPSNTTAATGFSYSAGVFTNDSTPKIVLVVLNCPTSFATTTASDVMTAILLNGTNVGGNYYYGTMGSPGGSVDMSATCVVKVGASGTISTTIFQASGVNKSISGGAGNELLNVSVTLTVLGLTA